MLDGDACSTPMFPASCHLQGITRNFVCCSPVPIHFLSFLQGNLIPALLVVLHRAHDSLTNLRGPCILLEREACPSAQKCRILELQLIADQAGYPSQTNKLLTLEIIMKLLSNKEDLPKLCRVQKLILNCWWQGAEGWALCLSIMGKIKACLVCRELVADSTGMKACQSWPGKLVSRVLRPFRPAKSGSINT